MSRAFVYYLALYSIISICNRALCQLCWIYISIEMNELGIFGRFLPIDKILWVGNSGGKTAGSSAARPLRLHSESGRNDRGMVQGQSSVSLRPPIPILAIRGESKRTIHQLRLRNSIRKDYSENLGNLVFSRRAFSGEPTRIVLRTLDWLAEHTLPAEKLAGHHRTGRRGEEAAYFHLRKLGYTMVARNVRSARCRGEIDLIGWDAGVLCFVEVKTRTTRDVKPGEAAVDRHKRRLVAMVARDYLRRLPPSCQWRFDVVSVYYGQPKVRQPQIEVFRNSSLTA